MEKTLKSLLVLSLCITLSFIAKGQIKYKGPVDSCGYMDKKYDSTITYYIQRTGKSNHWLFFMNLHDTMDKHSFFRQPIANNEVAKRLLLYKESKRKLNKSKWSLRAGIGLFCLYPVSLVFAIFEAQKSELVAWSIVLMDITGGETLCTVSNDYFVSAISEYNLITEERNKASLQ